MSQRMTNSPTDNNLPATRHSDKLSGNVGNHGQRALSPPRGQGGLTAGHIECIHLRAPSGPYGCTACVTGERLLLRRVSRILLNPRTIRRDVSTRITIIIPGGSHTFPSFCAGKPTRGYLQTDLATLVTKTYYYCP